MRATLWLCCLCLPTACAAQSRHRLPEGGSLVEGEVSELDVRGLHILVKRVPHQPIVACQLYIQGGVQNWTRSTAGIEKLALATALNGGTETLPKEAFHARLATLGTQLAVESGEDFSVIGFKALARHFASSFDLLSDTFLHPALPASELELERQLQLSELRQEEETPDAALWKLSHAQVYQGLPYAWRAQGTPESVASLTRVDLVNHLARLRETSRLLLVVVGDVEAGEIARLVAREFAGVARGDFRAQAPQSPRLEGTRVERVERPVPTHYVAAVFVAPTWGDPSLPVGIVAMSSLRDKLFEEIRTKRELSYAPSAGLIPHALGQGYLYVTAVDVAETIQVMREVVRAFKAGEIDGERLEGDKRTFLTEFLLQNEATSGQAELLARAQLTGGDWRLARELPARVKEVTAGEVAAFFGRYLRNLQVVVLGRSEPLDPAVFAL